MKLRVQQVEDWINVPPVFIVGSYRSGTSLLRLMLSAHSKVWISGEGAYIYKLREQVSTVRDISNLNQRRNIHEWIIPLLQQEKWLGIPSFDDLEQWTQRNGSTLRSLITFYNTWDARLLEKEELAWWGDNAPYHVSSVPYFHEVFPESKYINILRDPRDVFTSMKSYRKDVTLETVMNTWYNSVYYGILSERFVGPLRFLTIKYESLVTNPENVLKQVCDFLDIPYESAMLSYHESKAAVMLSQLEHHRNVVKPIFPDSVGKFRQMLSKEEINEIERRFTTHLRCLGYQSQEEHLESLGLTRD